MQYISAQSISDFDKRYRANLINSVSGFKNAGLIGTFNKDGKTNLAIFSQIFHIGANPPLLGILFRPHSVVRHTLENILETHSFTINHIQKEFLKEAHHTSARWEDSEFEACGIEAAYSEHFSAPYVKEAHVQIGCKFVERQDIQANDTILIVGRIEEIRLTDGIVQKDGFVDLEKAGSVCISGMDSYHQTSKLARYSYAKPDRSPEEI